MLPLDWDCPCWLIASVRLPWTIQVFYILIYSESYSCMSTRQTIGEEIFQDCCFLQIVYIVNWHYIDIPIVSSVVLMLSFLFLYNNLRWCVLGYWNTNFSIACGYTCNYFVWFLIIVSPCMMRGMEHISCLSLSADLYAIMSVSMSLLLNVSTLIG